MILPTKYKHQAQIREDQDLFDYLASLNAQHWTMRSIACALDVSPSTVFKYVQRGEVQEHYVKDIDVPDEYRPVQELPTNDWHRLRGLSQWARKAASASPSPRAKQASSDLNIYIRILTDEGYSQRQIAQACSISKTAVAQRIAKTVPGQYTREDLP